MLRDLARSAGGSDPIDVPTRVPLHTVNNAIPHHAILLGLSGDADPVTRRAILTHATATLTHAGYQVTVLGN